LWAETNEEIRKWRQRAAAEKDGSHEADLMKSVGDKEMQNAVMTQDPEQE